MARASTLPDVEIDDSCVSVPGARSFKLDPVKAHGRADAFHATPNSLTSTRWRRQPPHRPPKPSKQPSSKPAS
jgi:hypothetical protein